jgi:predicted site-specific integrase-resolvase
MVLPEEAARRWSISVRTVYRWMDTGTVHFLEVPAGVLLCLNSIKT